MKIWENERWVPGVLSKSQVKKLIEGEYFESVSDFDKNADHSSIDLTLSADGYQMMKGSIKPCGDSYNDYLKLPFAKKLQPNKNNSFELSSNNCYVFRLNERLLPKLLNSNIFGQATAKSSVGRMDVIARLIVDGMQQYEYFESNSLDRSSGKLFLEITPISFNVRVKEGVSLSQLRLFFGKETASIIEDKGFIKNILIDSQDGEGYLSVDLRPTEIAGQDAAAFKVESEGSNQDFLDLWIERGKVGPDPKKYWTLVKPENDRLKIKKDNFYILRSKERIILPPSIAVYCRAMDESLGEMRIHYAGFVHPFFGMNRKDSAKGTPLIFEVRGHNVDVNLRNGERLAKLVFYRMSEDASKKTDDSIDSQKEKEKEIYSNQELKLSKFFGEWQ